MTIMIGHDDIRLRLEQTRFPAVLLLGPPSVGKHTLARYIADHYGTHPADVRDVDKLDVLSAKDIRKFVATAPMGSSKQVIARLDGASDSSLNSLLKVLEEPPPAVYFTLISTNPTLATVISRCQVFKLGLLTDEQVAAVLVTLGMSEAASGPAAKRGWGRVAPALEPLPDDSAKGSVLSVLKACADRDKEKLMAALVSWTPEAHELLRIWAQENITRQWRVFNVNESFGFSSRPVLFSLLRNLTCSARPKLAASTALTALLRTGT